MMTLVLAMMISLEEELLVRMGMGWTESGFWNNENVDLISDFLVPRFRSLCLSLPAGKKGLGM